MKTSLVALTIVFVVAMSSIASADLIRPMTPEGKCDVVLPPGTPVTVHIVQSLVAGSLGCEWRVNNPTEVGILSVSSSFPYTGDPFTGIKFTYPTCLSGSFVVCELTLINLGLEHCSHMTIWGPPGGGWPVFTNCSGNEYSSPGWYMFYNLPTESCSPPFDSCLIPLANESSTWGAVKSLYR